MDRESDGFFVWSDDDLIFDYLKVAIIATSNAELISRISEGQLKPLPSSLRKARPLMNGTTIVVTSAKEATAMLHFLNARNGTEAFLYTPPEPYATMRLFSCFNWNQQSQFLNNININAEFTEVSV